MAIYSTENGKKKNANRSHYNGGNLHITPRVFSHTDFVVSCGLSFSAGLGFGLMWVALFSH